MRAQFLAIFAGLAFLPGCGGGGGNSSSVAALATHTRILRAGDRWVYKTTGTIEGGIGQLLPVTGDLTVSISSQPFNGGSALALHTVSNTTSEGQTATTDTVTFISQDPSTGAVSELGDNNGPNGANEVLVKPQIIFPAVWSTGSNTAANLDFGSGVTFNYMLNVTGTDTVATPAGTFKVWVANAGAGSGVTQDWAPQISAFVKVTVDNGAGGTTTALLQSTNVAP